MRIGPQGLKRYRAEMGDEWLCMVMGLEVAQAARNGETDFAVLTLRDYLSSEFGTMPRVEYLTNLDEYARQAAAFVLKHGQ